MNGYAWMRPKAWRESWPINRAGIVGGPFEERDTLREELLDCLHAGPGAAARQEIAVGGSCPVPCRWTLRTSRVSLDWLSTYTLSGVWRVLQLCGLTLQASCVRLLSPDPDYHRKVQRLPRGLRDAARHPEAVVALFWDDFVSRTRLTGINTWRHSSKSSSPGRMLWQSRKVATRPEPRLV